MAQLPPLTCNTEPQGKQADLFSPTSYAFIDVQSDLSETTPAYLRILIHNMNHTLFPNADPSSTNWMGPPPRSVVTLCLVLQPLSSPRLSPCSGNNRAIGTFKTRMFAKSQNNRQRKLDGFNKRNFRLVIENLPVMFQLALLLLGCALSPHP